MLKRGQISYKSPVKVYCNSIETFPKLSWILRRGGRVGDSLHWRWPSTCIFYLKFHISTFCMTISEICHRMLSLLINASWTQKCHHRHPHPRASHQHHHQWWFIIMMSHRMPALLIEATWPKARVIACSRSETQLGFSHPETNIFVPCNKYVSYKIWLLQYDLICIQSLILRTRSWRKTKT